MPTCVPPPLPHPAVYECGRWAVAWKSEVEGVDAYEKTLAHLGSDSVEPRDFASSLVDALPISGASVATVGGMIGSETVSASDGLAAHLDELQFDFTEGP